MKKVLSVFFTLTFFMLSSQVYAVDADSTNATRLAFGISPQADTPLYRFWSENFKHHFFTTSASERDELTINDPNWEYEGTAYNVESSAVGTTPVYRFWSENYKGHFYTNSDAEKQSVIDNDPNWEYEGEVFRVFPTDDSSRGPVYRFWSENYNGHFYTDNEAEKQFLIDNDPNWAYEGIVWYATPFVD